MSSGKKILLVDDDGVFVEAVSAVLEPSYEVESAANGTQALARVREDPPALVVLDVMMDHLSEGFDVARTMKKDPATSGIPIIMLTAVDHVYNMRMETDASWVPCDLYLEKPVSPRDLLAHVRDLIG